MSLPVKCAFDGLQSCCDSGKGQESQLSRHPEVSGSAAFKLRKHLEEGLLVFCTWNVDHKVTQGEEEEEESV